MGFIMAPINLFHMEIKVTLDKQTYRQWERNHKYLRYLQTEKSLEQQSIRTHTDKLFKRKRKG